MNLRTTRTITWTAPPHGEQATTALQVRATISTLNALQYARYQSMVRQARSWIDEEGKDADEAARLELLDVCLRWATVLASMTKLEQRTIERSAETEPEWTALDVPEDWRTPQGFVDNVPAELAAAVYVVVLEMNPGLFSWAGADDAEKKRNGGLSVS